MAAPPKAVVREVAQGVADLLNRQMFSQNFLASRQWIAVNDIEELEFVLVQVVPPDTRTITRASRGKDLHAFTLNVTAQKRLTGKNNEGDVAPVKDCDAAADFCQELEDFLLDAETSSITTDAGPKAVPLEAEATWDKEKLETQGIFAVNIAVAYRIYR